MSTLRCKEAFVAWVDGEPRTIPAGFLVDSKDAVVKGRESLFDQVDQFVERWGRPDRVEMPVVERATAAPGEKREVAPKPSPEPVEKKTPVVSRSPRGKQDGEV